LDGARVNFESNILLDTTIGKVQKALRAGDQPAIAVLEGAQFREHSYADYLRDPARADVYDQRLAAEIPDVDLDRLIIAAPMVVTPLPAVGEDALRLRSPYTGPLRDDHNEYEVIAYLLFDVDEGIDTGMVPFSRNPDATFTFGVDGDEEFVVSIPVSPSPGFPGVGLLRLILDEDLRLRPDLRPTAGDTPQ
jgi:hypothetical protein